MTNMDGKYMWLRKILKNMDEKQLIELFYDVNDLEALRRIFLKSHQVWSEIYKKSQSSYEDSEHEAQDNRDRAADINSNLGDK